MQILMNGKIFFREETYSVAKECHIFFVTKLKEINNIDNAIIANVDIENLSYTKWFEISTVFAVNPQIEQLCTQLITSSYTKTHDILSTIKQLKDYTDSLWQEIFSNPQKSLTVKTSAETISSALKQRNNDSTVLLPTSSKSNT